MWSIGADFGGAAGLFKGDGPKHDDTFVCNICAVVHKQQ